MPLLLPSGVGPGLVTGRLFRMANGNAAYVSATVAGAAVVVSGVMQYLTLRRAKEDAERTITATERTARMTALSKRDDRLGAGAAGGPGGVRDVDLRSRVGV